MPIKQPFFLPLLHFIICISSNVSTSSRLLYHSLFNITIAWTSSFHNQVSLVGTLILNLLTQLAISFHILSTTSSRPYLPTLIIPFINNLFLSLQTPPFNSQFLSNTSFFHFLKQISSTTQPTLCHGITL